MKRYGAGIAVIFAIAVGVLWWQQTDTRPLLERATRVGKIPVGEIPYGKETLDILPISTAEVLVVSTGGGIQRMNVVDGMGVQSLHVHRVDFTKGTHTRVPALEKAISDWPWFGFRISPDGRYLICQRNEPKRKARLIDLRTYKVANLELAVHENVAWQPDSRGFLSFAYEGKYETVSKARQTSVANLKQHLSLAVKPPLTWMIMSSAWGPAPAIAPDGSVIILASYQESRTHPWRMTFRLQRFQQTQTELKKVAGYQFDPPNIVIPTDTVKVSSDGKRLLWLGVRTLDANRKNWEIYTANLDGSERRMIGNLEVQTEAPSDIAPPGFEDGAPPPQFTGLAWMPDGRTICFVAERGIYTIPDR